jgi:hypothetical protein
MLVATLLLASLAHGLERFDGRAYYIGDPHQHTGISGDGFSTEFTDPEHEIYDEVGSVEAVFETARSNGLDWVSLSDHANGPFVSSESDWAWLWQMTLEHDDEATGLVVVPSGELYMVGTDGRSGDEHRNLYLFADDERLSDFAWDDFLFGEDEDDIEILCEDVYSWLDELSGRFGELLYIPHHPANLAPTNWDCWHEDYTPAVEVYSGWGSALGEPLDWWEPPTFELFPEARIGTAMDPDGFARRFSFWGGSDGHVTQPGDLCISVSNTRVNTGGLTIVVLEEDEPWTRASLHQALLDRRSYASSGPLLPVALELYASGERIGGLGDWIEPFGGEPIRVEIRVPEEDAFAVLDVMVVTSEGALLYAEPAGGGRWLHDFGPDEVPTWFHVAVQLDGLDWYGPDRCDDGGEDDLEWLWLTPTWVDSIDHDWDGDGWSWSDGDCDDEDPEAWPGAPGWSTDCQPVGRGCACAAAPRPPGGQAPIFALLGGLPLAIVAVRRRNHSRPIPGHAMLARVSSRGQGRPCLRCSPPSPSRLSDPRISKDTPSTSAIRTTTAASPGTASAPS